MNRTIQLLRFIGSPNVLPSVREISSHESNTLFSYSLKNRFSLLYLEEAKRRNLSNFRPTYRDYMTKYHEMFEAIERISQVLSKGRIEHAIFKTIRPYISTTVDIDVIIFGETTQYKQACDITKAAGYQKIVKGPMSTTLKDPRIGMGIDLYDEVAVSYLPYIDKDKLVGDVVDIKSPNSAQVRILTREADLVSLIAHSIVKENMYTLSEFYTYVYYLEDLDVSRFLQLTKEMHLKHSVGTHTAITALLYESAYKTIPEKIRRILDSVGPAEFEAARTANNELRMPHKYHPTTLARCLLELAQERKTRSGILTQFAHSFDRRFLKDFMRKIGEHMTRTTY